MVLIVFLVYSFAIYLHLSSFFVIFVFWCKFSSPLIVLVVTIVLIDFLSSGAVTLMVGGDTMSPYVMFSRSVCAVLYQSMA